MNSSRIADVSIIARVYEGRDRAGISLAECHQCVTSPDSIDFGHRLTVRRLLHGMAFRFRLHRKDLPGTPDIVLPGRRRAIFVHGCFRHAHGCKIGRAPKSRLDYWLPKLAENKRRDDLKRAALEARGWQVLTVWQCETRNPRVVVDILVAFLDGDVSDRHPAMNVLELPQHTDATQSR